MEIVWTFRPSKQTKNSSFSSPPASFFPARILFPCPHPFSLPHGFFFFLCCIFEPFKEFPLRVLVYFGHFAPFGIVRFPFGNFRQFSLADEYPYLGITFHYAGGFKLARKRLYNKALQAYHSIFKNFSNVDRVPVTG